MTRNMFGGSSQANRGKVWEALLGSQHTAYNQRGAARIWRNEPEVRNLGNLNGSGFRGQYTGKALPDYSGLSDGDFWHVEAKEVHKPRFDFELLKAHQAEELERSIRQGGGGYLLLHDGEENQGHLLCWTAMRAAWFADRLRWEGNQGMHPKFQKRAPRGSASMSRAAMEKASLHTASPVFGFDYLQPLLTHLRSTAFAAERVVLCAEPFPAIHSDWKRKKKSTKRRRP